MPKAPKPKKAKPKATTMAAAGRATTARTTRKASAAATIATTANATATNATATNATASNVTATNATTATRTSGRALRSRGACEPSITLEALQQLTRKPRKRRAVKASETIQKDTGSQEHAEEITGATTGESSGEYQTRESSSESNNNSSNNNQVDEPAIDGITTDQDPSDTDYDGEANTGHKTPVSSSPQVQPPPVAEKWYIDQAVQTELSPLRTGVEDKSTEFINVVGYTADMPAAFSSVRKQGLILTREELELILEHRKSRELHEPAKPKTVTNWHSILHGPVTIKEGGTATSAFLRADDPIATDGSLLLHDLFTDAENPKWITGDSSFFQPTELTELNDVDMHDAENYDLADKDAEVDQGSDGDAESSDRDRRGESARSMHGPSATGSEPEVPAATPQNKAWGIFSLPNSIARGLSSTVSSLLGQRHQAVNNSGPSRNTTRSHRTRKVNSDARRKKPSEKGEEQHRTVAHLQGDLYRAKKQMDAKRQKYDAPLKPPRRKTREALKAGNTLDRLDIFNTPRMPTMSNSTPTRKRKYDAPPGTSYGLPDELFHSSDSDEPATPPGNESPLKGKEIAGKKDAAISAERPTKKARVETIAEPRRTSTSPRSDAQKVKKAKKPKKIFSPPEGASYGLSEAFYAYTSSEESDDDDDQDTKLSDVPQTTTVEPPKFFFPAKNPQDSEVADDRQVTWTKPPPPPPTPAHARLPGERAEGPETSALARARSLTEQYKPVKPSGLRRVSILSVSTASPSGTSSPGTRQGDFAGQEEGLQQEPAQYEGILEDTRAETSGSDGGHAVVDAIAEVPQQKLSQLGWSESEVAGLDVDVEVLKALNDNWSKEDEECAHRTWAPYFANLRAKNEVRI